MHVVSPRRLFATANAESRWNRFRRVLNALRLLLQPFGKHALLQIELPHFILIIPPD
jgi:hypothetical protein